MTKLSLLVRLFFCLAGLISPHALAKTPASPDTKVRELLQDNFVELHLQGATHFCAASQSEWETQAKALAFDKALQTKPDGPSEQTFCGTLSLKAAVPKEVVASSEFFSDARALHRSGQIRVCAKENDKPSAYIKQILVKRLGEISRTLSLGESIVAKLEAEGTPELRHKHRRKDPPQQVLCTLVRLEHFDSRHPSLAFEHFRDQFEGTGRADASLSF